MQWSPAPVCHAHDSAAARTDRLLGDTPSEITQALLRTLICHTLAHLISLQLCELIPPARVCESCTRRMLCRDRPLRSNSPARSDTMHHAACTHGVRTRCGAAGRSRAHRGNGRARAGLTSRSGPSTAGRPPRPPPRWARRRPPLG
eukprot:1446459-Prymnesium_polylepis.1